MQHLLQLISVSLYQHLPQLNQVVRRRYLLCSAGISSIFRLVFPHLPTGEGMWPIVAHARIFSGYLSEYFQEICEEHGRACPLRADMTNWGTCGALGLREVQNFWGKVQTLFRKGGDHAFQIEFGNNYLVCKPNCMFIWTQWQLIYWETGMPRITMGGAARSHELNSDAWEMWHIQIQVANTNTN